MRKEEGPEGGPGKATHKSKGHTVKQVPHLEALVVANLSCSVRSRNKKES